VEPQLNNYARLIGFSGRHVAPENSAVHSVDFVTLTRSAASIQYRCVTCVTDRQTDIHRVTALCVCLAYASCCKKYDDWHIGS